MPETYNLPAHGRIQCAVCHHPQAYAFDRTRTQEQGWRITNNPLAWGGSEPEIIVLGFSKGPTQAGALAASPHNSIAFKGGRRALAKILHHIGLLDRPEPRLVDSLIADPDGPMHFGSLIRCTVERWDEQESSWLGTGGGMLDRFVATDFGARVAERCGSMFLGRLPERTRLVVMLGLGSKLNYVRTCRQLFEGIRPGQWQQINDVSYTDGKVVIVHTEHFASQGALLPNWLSGEGHERGRLGLLAREAAGAARIGCLGRGISVAARGMPQTDPTRLHSAAAEPNQPTATTRHTRNEPETMTGNTILQRISELESTDGTQVPIFVFRPERAQAFGRPLRDGRFLVCAGSTAMRRGSPNKKRDLYDRDELVRQGVLVPDADPSLYRFTQDHVFSSSSKAAGIIKDGNASGPGLWRDTKTGMSLKDYLASI